MADVFSHGVKKYPDSLGLMLKQVVIKATFSILPSVISITFNA
jgi:hypothetical protein